MRTKQRAEVSPQSARKVGVREREKSEFRSMDAERCHDLIARGASSLSAISAISAVNLFGVRDQCGLFTGSQT